jgi:hypothetical protein
MLYAPMAEPEPTHEAQESRTDAHSRTYYLRDLFSLAYIVKTVCRPPGNDSNAVKVHYPMPPTVADHPIHTCSRNVKQPLSLNEACILPTRDVSDVLVRDFFTCILILLGLFLIVSRL